MNDRIDLLNREDFIENVITIVNQLSENKKGCCFAIEGGWGIGKTFVIEEVEEKLKLIQSEETNDDRYFVFHYNYFIIRYIKCGNMVCLIFYGISGRLDMQTIKYHNCIKI